MKKIDEALMNEYLDRMNDRLPRNKWEKYLRNKVAWIVKLTDGTLFTIEKPSIETSFCFGESGYDYDDANRYAADALTNENLFRVRNLRDLNEKIKVLTDGPEFGYRVWVPVVSGCAEYLNYGRDWQYNCSTCDKLDIVDEDRNRLLEGYKIVRDRFAIRIDAYLKRYGLSKVHSWTYWRDA